MNQCADEMNSPVVSCLKSGKCVAKIRHPIRKVCVCVGIYSTPQEAADACNRKKLEYESHSEQETVASLCTDVATDFEKHPGIKRLKSGKWWAVIKHDNVNVSLGSYDTPSEAVDAYNMSKLELQAKLGKKRGSVYQVKSGKWRAEIKKGKVRHKLGSYATAEDAREALNRKKRELDEDAQEAYDSKQSNDRLGSCELGLQKNQRMRCVYLRNSGRWQTVISHPVKKARVCLGTFDTAEEAKEAYDSKMREFDLMFPGHRECNQTNDSCDLKADPGHLVTSTEEASCEDDATLEGKSDKTRVSCGPLVSNRFPLGAFVEEAKEAYDSKMGEFDLMFPDHKKCNPAKGSCELDAEQSQKNQRLHHVFPTKSGQWITEIEHPVAKAKSRLGSFDTAEEAKEAYDSKRRELGLQADAEQSQKNQRPRGVYLKKSGRWETEITHPVTKARIHLGTFSTAEEALEAKDSKRREFDSMFPDHKKPKQMKGSCEQSQKNQRLHHVYPTKSGRWTTEIGHPITKARLRLGSFDTAEEAKEAYDSKRREFDLMSPSNKKLKQLNDSCKGDAIPEGKSDSACVSDDPSVYTRVHLGMLTKEAEEAYNNTMCDALLETFAKEAEDVYDKEMREFDLLVLTQKTQDQSRGSCGSDAIVEDKSDSDGSGINVDVESLPVLVTERRGDFDLGIIDSYGRLVGEYSRLDDELWIC